MHESAEPKKYETNKMLNFIALQTSIPPRICWALLIDNRTSKHAQIVPVAR
jgi:hypothetical protein